ncbi:VanZ family protein [Bacillus spizizenii]|uniref:VanZ family protein n=1 Tax=Bacillus spizizenii TaxID=96241 RepID=UPI00391804AA
MINGNVPVILISALFVIVFGIRFLRNRNKDSLLRNFYYILFGIYLSYVVSFTLFPLPYQTELKELMIDENLGVSNNLLPFAGIIESIQDGYYQDLITIALNILLFIPFGFALSILFEKLKKTSIILIGFFSSLVIESLQFTYSQYLGYNYRSFDVNDLIMNTLGTLIGVLIFTLLRRYLKEQNLLLNNNENIV